MSDEPRPGTLAARLSAAVTIVAVEDEHDIAEFLGAYFRASGYALVHVDPESPAQVAEAVRKHQASAVLLDLHLRGFHGLEAYRCLRDDPATAQVPVIVITADSRASTRTEAVSGGVDGFVTKPFNVKALFDLVQDRVQRAGMRSDVLGETPAGDVVTGLVTHGFVHDRLADELAMASLAGKPVSFALVKLRSLREINHRAGHAAGDFVLREVARRLTAGVPAPALWGRNGGDEFAVVLPGTVAEEAAAALTRALEEAAHVVELPGGAEARIELAAGLAAHPEHASTGDELYMAADVALADAVERDSLVTLAL